MHEHKKNRTALYIWGSIGFAVLIFLMLFSMSQGFIHIPVKDTAMIIFKHLGLFHSTEMPKIETAVILDVRLPRVLGAVLIGGILAVSGAVLQGILLNPLADPYTLGLSSGAALGASIGLVLPMFGIVMPRFLSVEVLAFTGAAAALLSVLLIASTGNRLNNTNLILAGVIVSAILSAAIGLLKFIADEQVSVIIFWLMGSLSELDKTKLLILAFTAFAGIVFSIFYSRDLNIMAMGEKTASSLGVNIFRLRLLMLLVTSLMTAAAVSFSGIIGFIGLIAPHIVRFAIGPDNRALLPFSFLTGAVLLLSADTITRVYLPAEVPVGILTALLGGPFFCFIFRRSIKGLTK